MTFDYNQRHNIEIEKSKITCEKTNTPQQIININFFGDLVKNYTCLIKNSDLKTPNIKEILGDPSPITYVPFRNLIFISLACSFAESNCANYVFIGLQTHDLYMYWDTTPQFLENVNNICNLNRKSKILINAPFINISKSEEILLGRELNVPFEDTFTCYNPVFENDKILACSTCPSCSERIKNFMDVNCKDPIEYKITPKEWS